MVTEARIHRSRADLTQEEAELARRALAGDRGAFDALFDRYYARLAWFFSDLPQGEARAAIWQTLEQIFVGLDSEEDLAARAYRIARR
jgi:hypothetical protein